MPSFTAFIIASWFNQVPIVATVPGLNPHSTAFFIQLPTFELLTACGILVIQLVNAEQHLKAGVSALITRFSAS